VSPEASSACEGPHERSAGKILDLITACEFSVHDASRVELDTSSGPPRFNMCLEGSYILYKAAERAHNGVIEGRRR
jgi:hypothetical protein